MLLSLAVNWTITWLTRILFSSSTKYSLKKTSRLLSKLERLVLPLMRNAKSVKKLNYRNLHLLEEVSPSLTWWLLECLKSLTLMKSSTSLVLDLMWKVFLLLDTLWPLPSTPADLERLSWTLEPVLPQSKNKDLLLKALNNKQTDLLKLTQKVKLLPYPPDNSLKNFIYFISSIYKF